MQAIIMAAGKGSRLGDITAGKPKSFMEIKGQKLIDYNIAMLKHSGIDDITIVTGHQSEDFTEITSTYSGVRTIFNPFYESTNVLCSFWTGMNFLKDDFIFLHADTICDVGIFKDLLLADGDIVLPVDFDVYNEEAMGVRCEEGRVAEINKAIPIQKADGEFIGIAKLSKRILEDLKEKTVDLLKEKKFNEYFEAAIQRLIDERKYNITTIATNKRFWAEIDFIEDYNKAVSEIPDNLTEMVLKNKSRNTVN